MSSADAVFRTYQTVRNYENALRRHGQSILWTRAILCPCIDPNTRQPELSCPSCRGRGRLYRPPGVQQVYNEAAKHTVNAVTPRFGPLSPNGILRVRVPKRDGTGLTQEVTSSPAVDGRGINLSGPLVPLHPQEHVYIDYAFDPSLHSVDALVDEHHGTGDQTYTIEGYTKVSGYFRTPITPEHQTHRHLSAVRSFGKGYIDARLSIKLVYRTYDSDGNVVAGSETDVPFTFDENTGVVRYRIIEGDGSLPDYPTGGSWKIHITYSYNRPFRFVINNISEKQRYTSPYITQEADAVLTLPSWARVSPNDLFTVLAAEQTGEEIIDPNQSASLTDYIRGYYDVVRILEVVDKTGKYHTGYTLQNNDELVWTVKPTTPYTVQFLYNPTYVAVEGFPTLRAAENKQFPQKINLKKWSRTDSMPTH